MDRLDGHRIRMGLFVRGHATVPVLERIVAPGTDVTLGAGDDAVLRVPGWQGPNLLLLAGGRSLHLAAGMSLMMCHDGGLDRTDGTFEELTASGLEFPLHVNVSMLNIRARDGVTVLVKYLRDGQPR